MILPRWVIATRGEGDELIQVHALDWPARGWDTAEEARRYCGTGEFPVPTRTLEEWAFGSSIRRRPSDGIMYAVLDYREAGGE